MGEFFWGWRRKLGVVTLGLSCMLTVGWVRSLVELDALALLNAHNSHLVISAEGGISWERIWPIMKTRPSRWLYKHNEITKSNNPYEGIDVHWNVTGLGFDFRDFARLETAAGVAPYTQEYALWQIPYWSIVIPLSLISLWLLLFKLRKSTQTKLAEPIAEQVK